MKMSPGEVSLTLARSASMQLLMLLPHAACTGRAKSAAGGAAWQGSLPHAAESRSCPLQVCRQNSQRCCHVDACILRSGDIGSRH